MKRSIKITLIVILVLIALFVYLRLWATNSLLQDEKDYYKEHAVNFCKLAQNEAESIQILHNVTKTLTNEEFNVNVSFTNEILEESFCKDFIVGYN